VKSENHRGHAEVKTGNHRGRWAGRQQNDEENFVKMNADVEIIFITEMELWHRSDIPFRRWLQVVQQIKSDRSTYLGDAPCGGRSWPWRYRCWCGRVRGWWWQESGAGRTRRWRRRRGRKLPAVGHVTTLSDHNSAVTNKQISKS
jgi:hypothetical protein